jgi:hypothetical protein
MQQSRHFRFTHWLIGAVLLLVVASAQEASAAPKCDLHASKAPDDAVCMRAWMDEHLHVNDLVSVGTHNSYKRAIPDTEMEVLRKRSAKAGVVLDYSHRPLVEELDDGARQLELDVYYDPQGGRFANPLGPRSVGGEISKEEAAELARPGFKVMHVPDYDFRSTCTLFVECLKSIKAWSASHRDHVPILILINAKDDTPLATAGGASVLKFDTAAFDAFDAEIASVFTKGELITPDEVQGKHATLRDGVLAGGWPKLRNARGRIFFALDEPPAKVAIYRGNRRSLEGRLSFINTDETSPAAAYLTLNEPIEDTHRIRAAVEAGFIVRTRADADTAEARANDTRRRETAFASGAQYISTDYLRAEPRFSAYFVRLPNNAITLCNPIRVVDACGGHIVQ